MARKTATQTTNTGTTAKKAVARRTTARKTTPSTAAAAVKKSTEIKPQRAGSAVERLKSPKVYVPLAMVVGLGVAAVRKVVNAASKRGPQALPRLAKEISPRFSEAVRALADLGRELRSKLR